MAEKPATFNIRPDKKFNPEKIEGILRGIVYEQLQGKVYDHMYAPDWTKSLTLAIRQKVGQLATERYKFAVQVTIGEDRGQGLKAISGCLWDGETDGKATVLFTNETMFCIVAVFAVFCYCYE